MDKQPRVSNNVNSCIHFVHKNSSVWVNFRGHFLGEFSWTFLVNFGEFMSYDNKHELILATFIYLKGFFLKILAFCTIMMVQLLSPFQNL